MNQESFYVGTDLKFRLDIEASGFSQDADRYEVTLIQGNQKWDVPASDIVEGEDGHYLLVDTTQFRNGLVRMVVTAYIKDNDFPKGVRREVAAMDLCYIKDVNS